MNNNYPKTATLLKNLTLIITSFCLLCCGGAENSNFESNQNLNSHDKEMVENGAFVAQEVIRNNFDADCKFKHLSLQGEPTMVENRYKIMQFFVSKHEGEKYTYLYKAYVQLKQGTPKNASNWAWSEVKIENITTGQQWVYNSNSIDIWMNRFNGNVVDVEGIKVLIESMNDQAVVLATDKELSKKEIKKIFAFFVKTGMSSIHLYTKKNLKNGDSYADYIGGTVFDYTGGKKGDICKFNEW